MNEDIIKLALVDDHLIMRNGLAKELSTDPAIKVVMEAKHGLDLLKQLEQGALAPDIAIMDLQMPVMDGFALLTILKDKYPEIRVLILSGYSTDYDVTTMISKGARGYLLKDGSPDELVKAIYQIYETGYYYSEVANEHLFKMLEKRSLKSANIPEREMEFLILSCTTLLGYDKIAEKMGISLATMHGTRRRLFDRLGIETRNALIIFALNSGIVKQESKTKN